MHLTFMVYVGGAPAALFGWSSVAPWGKRLFTRELGFASGGGTVMSGLESRYLMESTFLKNARILDGVNDKCAEGIPDDPGLVRGGCDSKIYCRSSWNWWPRRLRRRHEDGHASRRSTAERRYEGPPADRKEHPAREVLLLFAATTITCIPRSYSSLGVTPICTVRSSTPPKFRFQSVFPAQRGLKHQVWTPYLARSGAPRGEQRHVAPIQSKRLHAPHVRQMGASASASERGESLQDRGNDHERSPATTDDCGRQFVIPNMEHGRGDGN